MQTTFTVTYNDYQKAFLEINNKILIYSKTKRRATLLVAFFFFWILPFSSYIIKFVFTFFFFLLIHYFLFDRVIHFYLKTLVQRKVKESNYPIKVTFLINENHFIYKSEKNEFTVPWKSITLAVEIDVMYIFYSSSISTFYIVKKKTGTSTNLSEFDRTIKNILTENSILLH